jgi:hypothetical protein
MFFYFKKCSSLLIKLVVVNLEVIGLAPGRRVSPKKPVKIDKD